MTFGLFGVSSLPPLACLFCRRGFPSFRALLAHYQAEHPR